MEGGMEDLVGQTAASLLAVVGVNAQRTPSSFHSSLPSSPSLWREDEELLGDGMQGEMGEKEEEEEEEEEEGRQGGAGS